MTHMANQIKLVFDNQYHGMLTGHHGAARVGPEEGALAPYDMVLGGLAACLNHTFQTVLDKKRLSFHAVKYDVTGEKRTEVPTTLKTVVVNIEVTGAPEDKQEHFRKAMAIATEHCSVFVTLSQVAEMTWNIRFI